ncbi:MAG: baseplate J/gp47 family protein [Nannocystaceae bacterium]
MPNRPEPPRLQGRDGQSQAARAAPALDPRSAEVDERGPREWLELVRRLARSLRFVDPSSPGQELDWSGLLGDLDLDRVVAFMDDPGQASAAEAERLGRPHLALLLAFLRLLGVTRDHQRDLTRRHLDFTFAEVLRLDRRPPAPDHVTLVMTPARGVDRLEIPAGTEFNAGTDGADVDRIYRSDHPIVVGRAEVAALQSLHVDRRVTGIREAHERRDPGTDPADRFLRMFTLALGAPLPGDPLAPFEGAPVDLPALLRLRDRVRFAAEGLHLELFEVRALCQLKRRRDGADAEWAAINGALEAVGRRRSGDPNWRLDPADPRSFRDNLERALGAGVGAEFFAGLPEVRSVDDLHDQRLLEVRADPAAADQSDVAAFIRGALRFPALAEFDGMMALKRRIDGEWAEVVALLERAGQRRRGDRTYRLATADPTDFAANFAAAIGGEGFAWPADVADLDGYDAALSRLEEAFAMSAETFAYVTAAAPDASPPATAKQWSRIYEMLAAAHRAKVYAGRRARLAAIRLADGWSAALALAAGVAPGAESPLPSLRAFIPRVADLALLTEIEATVKAHGGDESSVDEATWARAIQIVELAQRGRERLPEPIARRVEWRNLYPHPDARAVVVADGSSSPRWRTFGDKPAAAGEDRPPAASFGFAIASPMLALREGERTVVVTFGLDPATCSIDPVRAALALDPFVVEASAASGWVRPSSMAIELGEYAALAPIERPLSLPLTGLRLTLTFDVDVDPLAAMAPADAGIASAAPLLRVLLRPIWDPEAREFITLYEPFRALCVAALHLRCEVRGLTSLTLVGERGAIDPRRPFPAFGVAPASGSRLAFGHPELARNALDALTLHLEWMGAPTDLGAHYAGYGLGPVTNERFTATIRAIDHRRPLELRGAAPLFAAEDAGAPRSIAVRPLPPALQRIRDFTPTADLLEWRRYFELELGPLDLQHGTYGATAGRRALELAAAIAGGQPVVAADYQVNPPYTPTLRRITVDYAAGVELRLDQGDLEPRLAPGEPAGDEAIFHVRPFGAHPIRREEGASACRLLPAHDHAGELYIGLRGVAAPQRLSLLFQVAEGSADADVEPEAIEWSYLSGDRWLSLHGGELHRDATRGLLNSGILELTLPAAAPSLQLRPDLYWLRAAVRRSPGAACDLVAIHAQAVRATFVDRGNAAEHYDAPLPAGSVVGPVVREPGLAAVAQPYTSAGGRPREHDADYYVRVSERIRHKDRALTPWDYERLVLDRFPGIYKVKCIPADVAADPDALGRVELVVVPDIRDRLPFDPFEPKVPADRVAEIQGFIAPLAPPFADVVVRNPRYVAVKARFGVRFRAGEEPGAARARLSDELCRFLSPWAYAEGADIVLGGRIYASSIIDFVDRRGYVDHLATIKLFRSTNGRDFEYIAPPSEASGEGYHVAAERPDEVLVAARDHEIDVITDVHYESELFTGISHMKVELDFSVG